MRASLLTEILNGITTDSFTNDNSTKIIKSFENCIKTKSVTKINAALHQHLIQYAGMTDVDYSTLKSMKYELGYDGGMDRLIEYVANMSRITTENAWHRGDEDNIEEIEEAVRVNFVLKQMAIGATK